MTDEPTAESEQITEPAQAAGSPPSSDGRRALAALFWLLASLSIMLSSVTVWAHQTLLTADGWGGIVEDVVAEPEVTHNISAVVVGRVSDALDVQDVVADVLPGSLDIVAGALTSAVEDRIVEGVAGFMATDGFRDAFVNANKAGHEAAMRAIRGGDREALTSQDGLITLSIFPIIEGVLRNLQDAGLISADREIPDLTDFQADSERIAQLESLLGRDLPDDLGTIVLIDAEGLALVQEVVRYFDLVTVGLLILTLLFVVAALWLSVSRVRMTLWLAGGAIAALALGRIVARIILNRVTQRAQEGDAAPTAAVVVDVAVDSLLVFTFVVMAAAVIVAIAAWWWERRASGERAAMETPPRTLRQSARDHARELLAIGIAVIAVAVVWSVAGADTALLTAAGLGLLGVGYHVLTRGDEATGDVANG